MRQKQKQNKNNTSVDMNVRGQGIQDPDGLVLTPRGQELAQENICDGIEDPDVGSDVRIPDTKGPRSPGQSMSFSERWSFTKEPPQHALCFDSSVPTVVRWGLPAFTAFSSALFVAGQILPVSASFPEVRTKTKQN